MNTLYVSKFFLVAYYLLLHSFKFPDSHLVRKSPPAYSDGVYMLAGQNRPSARKLSRLFMKGLDGLSSMTNRTALLAFFGQVVTSEVVMASESGCPIEMHHIEIEKCDDVYDKECRGDKFIPFHRAGFDRKTGQSPNSPREQVGYLLFSFTLLKGP